MAPEASFVLKRGEGLNNTTMIKHKVLHAEAQFTPKMAPQLDGMTKPVKTSYVSPMQRARQERKRREAGQSKDWDVEAPSSPGSSEASSGGTARVIPYSGGLLPKSGNLVPSSGNLVPSSGNLVPSSGNLVPSSGYIAKPRDSVSKGLTGSGRLPKFGVWDNQNDASGPCYTLLFENVAQEKRIGGPIRVHANRPASPARSEDLYSYNPGAIKARKHKLHLHHSLLCCFVGS